MISSLHDKIPYSKKLKRVSINCKQALLKNAEMQYKETRCILLQLIR